MLPVSNPARQRIAAAASALLGERSPQRPAPRTTRADCKLQE
jgi:hypothetical protein